MASVWTHRAEARTPWGAGLLVFLLAGIAWQCGAFGTGDCVEGETKCVDNVAMHCGRPCSDVGCVRHWEREDCGSATCIVPRGWYARCDVNPVVDPRCDNKAYCDGDQAVVCVGQYAIDRSPHCGPSGCIVRGDIAECVVPLDPACTPGRSTFCTTFQERLVCSEGRIVSRTQCSVCENGQCLPDAGAPRDAADAGDALDAGDATQGTDTFDADGDVTMNAGG